MPAVLRVTGALDSGVGNSAGLDVLPTVPSGVLIVGVRDDYQLHVIEIVTPPTEGSTGVVEFFRRKINMNANGDDFVSFTAMETSVSPNGRYVLVSTDKNRLILFHLASGSQVRNFYGAENDSFSQPRYVFCYSIYVC